MREAFVLRLGSDSDPREHRYVGWIEEVDTGRELHFRSTDELPAFLGTCLEATRERPRSAVPGSDEKVEGEPTH